MFLRRGDLWGEQQAEGLFKLDVFVCFVWRWHMIQKQEPLKIWFFLLEKRNKKKDKKKKPWHVGFESALSESRENVSGSAARLPLARSCSLHFPRSSRKTRLPRNGHMTATTKLIQSNCSLMSLRERKGKRKSGDVGWVLRACDESSLSHDQAGQPSTDSPDPQKHVAINSSEGQKKKRSSHSALEMGGREERTKKYDPPSKGVNTNIVFPGRHNICAARQVASGCEERFGPPPAPPTPVTARKETRTRRRQWAVGGNWAGGARATFAGDRSNSWVQMMVAGVWRSQRQRKRRFSLRRGCEAACTLGRLLLEGCFVLFLGY